MTSITDYALSQTLCAPSSSHWLGCDAFGRDVLGLFMVGAGKSISFSIFNSLLCASAAILLAAVLAISPRKLQTLGTDILDTWLAFPSILIILAIASVLGPGWSGLTLALFLDTTPSLCRLLVLRAREIQAQDFFLASIGLGASPSLLLSRYLIPELVQTAKIKLPNLLAKGILAEVSLTFLGLGAPIGEETWGSLLAQGQEYLLEAPHIAIGAGLPLILTIGLILWLSEKISKAPRI